MTETVKSHGREYPKPAQFKIEGTDNIFIDGIVDCIPFKYGRKHGTASAPWRFLLRHSTNARRRTEQGRWSLDRTKSFKAEIYIEFQGSLAEAVKCKVKEGLRVLVSGKLMNDQNNELIIRGSYCEILSDGFQEVLK